MRIVPRVPLPSNPHDAIFKAAFGQPDIARGELELVLPAAVRAHLDLATLEVFPGSFLDEELRATHTDLLYAVRTTEGREAFVFVLFEHQSSFDAEMPWRLLRYMVRVWESWKRDHPTAVALPIVLPVVLHHGATGWQAQPEFASMFDASPELLEAARPFQPQFRFLLDDLAVVSLDELRSRALHAFARLVLLGLWSSRSLPRLHDAAPFMATIIASLGRDERTRSLLSQLYVYLLRAAQPDVELDAVRTILLQVAGPQGQEDIVNAAEQLIEQGRAEGLQKGRAEGLQKGRAEGRSDGLRSAIAGLLSARSLPLSEVGRARLEACMDVGALTRWHARAVTAASEAEVFGDDAC